MEYWSVGVMGTELLHFRNTPTLHYSNTPKCIFIQNPIFPDTVRKDLPLWEYTLPSGWTAGYS